MGVASFSLCHDVRCNDEFSYNYNFYCSKNEASGAIFQEYKLAVTKLTLHFLTHCSNTPIYVPNSFRTVVRKRGMYASQSIPDYNVQKCNLIYVFLVLIHFYKLNYTVFHYCTRL